ncbi:MAG: rRNA maturation RNase YbeY [Elusimicrobia bacterium CG1_02_37_114]|nr:MAG: rRNA maturation RNase YbeY [Elusimicrobia bacterium CG1_02_37_114]PIV53952.1 MAG: rRNA maturation RNase YbeY [Elusimicrobia bacterium CG02_land_8_20_14_3_00_37_13]PIZ14058.1 MAG: rRNA maturation RNase YbeY [Elusimicrobia bacterium CG_4_10_14_0_8_um_filter_37_32]
MKKKKITSQKIRVHKFNTSKEVPEELHNKIREIVFRTLKYERHNSGCELAVILTSDDEIQKLNSQYLDREAPTDILCFPYNEKGSIAGDIFISLDRAEEQAEEYGNTFKQEILFLVIHGVLHLLDWRDDTESSRRKMLRRQEEILNDFIT